MTPEEWGRLQGFIGYGFVDEDGVDHFEFPDSIPEGQRYKQFGNAVSIPVIETMADFIYDRIYQMDQSYEVILCSYARKNSCFTRREAEMCLGIEKNKVILIIRNLLGRKVIKREGNGRNIRYYFIDM